MAEIADIDTALAHLSAHDPVMDELIQRYPRPNFGRHEDYYHALVTSIIGQQLSVKAARVITERFKGLFDGAFPSPEQIVTKSIEELRSAGLSQAKARYIQDLTINILDGTVEFSRFPDMTNDEIVAELTRVKGIGEWTAHMFLLFCMARLDVLPTGDLGIRTGVTRLYGFDALVTPAQVELVATQNSWQPYQPVASWYIWRSLENTTS